MICHFFFQAVGLLEEEVRSLLNLATVLSVHVIYPQAVDEVVPFMEEDGAEEVDFTCRSDIR